MLLLLALAIPLASRTGRAQIGASARFAFSDTTLLRDTLGLTFERLFPLADSLQVPPDSLRAWSIRHRFTIERLVVLADSLAMPVDSVGPVLLRERFNPLAATRRHVNDFTYNSTYSVSQTSNGWINGADVNIIRGSLFVRNNTSITLDNYGSGTRKSFQQNRTSQNELGWRFSPNLSLGGRANLDRFDNTSQGALLSESETKGEYQASVRTRQQPTRGITSELNFFGGLLDVNNVSLSKRGLLHDLNGRVRVTRGGWLTHDLQGQLNGNFSKSNAPGSTERVDTRDRSRNLRGTLGLLNSSPASLNINYNYRDVRVQNPAPVESLVRGVPITQVLTQDKGLDLGVRLRRDNDRYVNFSGRFGSTERATSIGNGQNFQDQRSFSTNGRYGLRVIVFDGNFNLRDSDSRFPRRSVKGGYEEDLFSRSVDGTATWTPTAKLIVKATGSVSLSSYRYTVIDSFTPPVPRDQYRQSYRIETLYNRTERFNTTVGLEVARTLQLNLPASSTAANNEIRTYRADWRWSYRLLSRLTATQRNQVTADYTYYPIRANNRLTLDYSTFTTLNAVLTSRLQMDINHSARYQPSGTYVRLEDGLDYLQRSDESNNYSLDARMAYSPFHGVSLNVRPQYVSSNRNGTVEGISVPQRRNRSLSFTGGASLDLPLGRRAQLTGDISRSFKADQSTAYLAGNPRPAPVAETDYWIGSLQLRWNL